MKPACPPVAGCSSRTTAATSCGPGSDDAGTKGSLRALSTSVGTSTAGQPRLRRRARPVVVGAREAVQRRRDDVVEVPHRAHARDARRVERAGKALCHGERLRLERRQEVPRVDAVEALADRDAGGHEVERHGHGGRRDERARALAAGAPDPVEEGASAERYADRVDRRAGRDARTDGGEHLPDLLVIARVVRAGPGVGRAAAAAEVRHHAAPAVRGEQRHHVDGVLRLRAPFEPVKHDDERGVRRRARRVVPVELPEVAIRRRNALAPVRDGGARQEERVDRLRVPARQPHGTRERRGGRGVAGAGCARRHFTRAPRTATRRPCAAP